MINEKMWHCWSCNKDLSENECIADPSGGYACPQCCGFVEFKGGVEDFEIYNKAKNMLKRIKEKYNE